jgi:peptide/nickel transport system permease protein
LSAVATRVAFSLAALFVASFLIFGATEALPGDAAQSILGKAATPDALAALRTRLGLDEPFLQRYGDWVGSAVRGDLGDSASSGLPVWELIGSRFTNSLLLAAFAVAITVPLSVLLGLVTGWRHGGWLDGTISLGSLILVSIPEFVLGILLAAVFGIFWPILPPTSLFSAEESLFDHLKQVILPAAAAGAICAGYIIRMTRAAALDVLDSDFVEAAKLRGLGARRILFRQVLRTSLIPTVNVIGTNVAWMFGGLVIVETVFAFPGIGSLLVQAASSQDAPLLAAVALIITTAYILINLLADLSVIALNPRLRAARRA